jgi:GH15 family glucan-1,4-alpha-glucosidase
MEPIPLTPSDRAELCLALLLSGDDGEAVAALQALQQLVQAELARRWAESPFASVGHTWNGNGTQEGNG